MDPVVENADSLVKEISFMLQESEDVDCPIQWTHSEFCPRAAADPAASSVECHWQCKQGILTPSHMKFFEQSITPNEDTDNVVVRCQRSSLNFICNWTGCVIGGRADRCAARSDREGAGLPNYQSGVTLATSAVSRTISGLPRAFYGEHGIISKTYWRCTNLLRKAITSTEALIEAQNRALKKVEEAAEKIQDLEGELSRLGNHAFPRKSRSGPTIEAGGGSLAVARSTFNNRRAATKPFLDAYLEVCSKVHLTGDSERKLDRMRLILSDLTASEKKRLYRLISSYDSSVKLATRIVRKQESEKRKGMIEKRKDEFKCAKLSTMLFMHGVNQQGYRSVLQMLREITGVKCQIMPTEAEVSRMSAILSDAAEKDFSVVGTPNGLAIDLRNLVELYVHLHESTPLPRPRDDYASSGKHVYPEKKVPPNRDFETYTIPNVVYIRITWDSRRDQKKPEINTTECAITLMLPGQIGGILAGMVLRMKTVALWDGKDTKEAVSRNLSDTFKQMKDLESDGIIYDFSSHSFFGNRNKVKDLIDANKLRKVPFGEGIAFEARVGEGWERMSTLKQVKIRFFVSADMAALISGAQCGGHSDPEKCFCTHCFEKLTSGRPQGDLRATSGRPANVEMTTNDFSMQIRSTF
jgi:hypothetical protein